MQVPGCYRPLFCNKALLKALLLIRYSRLNRMGNKKRNRPAAARQAMIA